MPILGPQARSRSSQQRHHCVDHTAEVPYPAAAADGGEGERAVGVLHCWPPLAGKTRVSVHAHLDAWVLAPAQFSLHAQDRTTVI